PRRTVETELGWGPELVAARTSAATARAVPTEKCGNSSLHTREVWQFKLAHQRGVRQFKLAHQTEWRQQAASAVCCGDINAIPEFSESLRHPIRQED
ncbi:MAG: hypothetical protein ACK559_02205, partial [bacterium]